MKTKININGKDVEIELTDEQVAKIKGTSVRWKPENRDIYFYLDCDGVEDEEIWYDTERDIWRYSQGNCFKTEEEAEAYKEYLIAKARIKESAKNFIPDWQDTEQEKWCAFYDNDDREFYVGNFRITQYTGQIYFATKEDLQTSLKELEKEWNIIREYKG